MVEEISVRVLGSAQDAGLPHIGCQCPRCSAARRGRPRYAASLAVIAREAGAGTRVWLLDCTPDIGPQLQLLADDLGPHPQRPQRLRQPDGIFLTHAHMGHVGGLPQLGPEALHVADLPIYAAPPLLDHLRSMVLWQPLLAGLRLLPLVPHRPVALTPTLSLTPIPVPHRDEVGSGTYAFLLRGPRRSLLYLPDIDAWDVWPAAAATLSSVDIALVDASFFSREELGGRPPVGHPLVGDTLRFAAGLPGALWLTHLNHTNPLLDPDSPAQRVVQASGAGIVVEGQAFSL
jgi:pyrroloquinoline quinone biosynthesis protein B